MERWYSKFKRGDVWYLHMDTESGDGIEKSSVQRKSRPYVIVSCEENNNNAPTFNVLPICTRNNDHLPMHVFFNYQDGSPSGRNQLVLCEQITTVSVEVFNNRRSYFMYSFHLNMMNAIDEALTRQLGLKPRVADMKVLERLIDEITAKKEAELKAIKEKELATRMEELAADIAARFGITLDTTCTISGLTYRPEELRNVSKDDVEKMTATAKERTVPREKESVDKASDAKNKLSDIPKPSKEETTTPTPAKRSGKRTQWTVEKKKEFVDDYAKMSVSEVAAKWNLTKKSIQTMAWMYRKELGI